MFSPQSQTLAIDRRAFLLASGTVGASFLSGSGWAADDRPTVTNPRATSGDRVAEPNWDERLTVTVGPKEAQLVGSDDKVIQAGIDYVARLGGGTVKILPGQYKTRNAVRLATGVRILGSGADSVVFKEPSHSAKLLEDSDWYDQEVTLAAGHGFRVGDGVCLRTKNPHHGGHEVLKRTFVARTGDRFKLDKALRKNFWLSGAPTAAALHPLFSGDHIQNVAIENLTFDGNRANNENFNGNYGGCIFLQDCNDIAIRDVTTRNYNGDGISWQICHDVTVENCHSHDNADLGLHPGSGSQRPVMVNNKLQRNGIGVFFCWGVKFGLCERNSIEDNRNYGVSIGHCDTDNLIRNNEILRSGKVGVFFRVDERGKNFAPHRNTVTGNRIVDSGAEQGIGVDLQGKLQSITIAENEIRETRGPGQRIGIQIGKEIQDLKLRDNQIEGFSVEVTDRRQ